MTSESSNASGKPILPDRLTLSVAEAARALGIGRATAYECVRTGALPSVRIGGRILIPTKQLLQLLDQAHPIADG